jgi:hypothetical protein
MNSLIDGLSKVTINNDTSNKEQIIIPEKKVIVPFQSLIKLSSKMLKIQSEKNIWKDSPLKDINDLKVDYSGKVGEVFISRLCKAGSIENKSTGDINSKDGTYDQIILSKKVEIKTARIGCGKFQHENLKSDGCEYYLFLDITPNYFYITIIPHFNLKEVHPITSTKPTLRKGTTDVFKWDFTEKHLALFELSGKCIKVMEDTTSEKITEFIKQSFQ